MTQYKSDLSAIMLVEADANRLSEEQRAGFGQAFWQTGLPDRKTPGGPDKFCARSERLYRDLNRKAVSIFFDLPVLPSIPEIFYSGFIVDSNSSLRAFQPRYQKVRHWLEDQLRQHAWKEGDRIPGESVLARNLGVSTVTVRQALNVLSKNGYLRREKGRGTFVAKTWPANSAGAEQENRQPHALFWNKAVGILALGEVVLSSRKRQIIEALEQGISRKGGRTVIHTCTPGNKNEMKQWASQVDGLEALVFIEHEAAGFGEKLLPVVDALNLPTVACEYLGSYGVSRVVEDHGCGMRMAVEHLKKLGHENIALVEFYSESGEHGSLHWTLARNQAFLEACRYAQLPVGKENILSFEVNPDFKEDQMEAGRQAAAQILDSRTPCTAIIGINDYIALGVLEVVKKRSLPISVVGFDNTPDAGLLSLTTLASPSAGIGEAATGLLEWLMTRPQPYRDGYYQMVVQPHLICRESTRPRQR